MPAITLSLPSFLFLIALARIFSPVLNRGCESRQPCLVPDLKGEAFCLCLLGMVLALFCVSVLYQVEGVPLHLFFFLSFIFWQHSVACGILVLQPGMEPVPPAVEAWSLKHWAASSEDFLVCLLLF